MLALSKGRYAARLAETPGDLCRAQELRHLAFIAGRGVAADGARAKAGEAGRDADAFDAPCAHVLIEETATKTLVCCFRLLPLAGGHQVGRSYSAQFYDLSALAGFPGPMAEVGRFCLHPDWHDPDILRLAWGALTRFVDATGTEMLFGCSSFPGSRAEPHLEAFALLKEAHLAPPRWRPGVKAPQVFRFARSLRGRAPDLRRALLAMPPLLRSYLLMGGWVSDHAVVDADLDTLHVFTGLEIRAIPPARARLLRGVAAEGG